MSVRFRSKALLGALALGAVVLAGPLAQGVGAQITVCYNDPIVTLSNGKVVQLAVTIGDQSSDVQQVAYVLHGPKHTSVVSVTYSGATVPESFTFKADAAAGTYDGDTTVTTGTAGASVTVTESVGQIQGFQQSGMNGQTVWTHVVSP